MAREAAARARGARKAQKAWAAKPLGERIALVLKAGIVGSDDRWATWPELACMMGRPVRYGGEFGGVNERAATWRDRRARRWRRS
jgi:hypothetical protein